VVINKGGKGLRKGRRRTVDIKEGYFELWKLQS